MTGWTRGVTPTRPRARRADASWTSEKRQQGHNRAAILLADAKDVAWKFDERVVGVGYSTPDDVKLPQAAKNRFADEQLQAIIVSPLANAPWIANAPWFANTLTHRSAGRPPLIQSDRPTFRTPSIIPSIIPLGGLPC